MTDEPDPTGTDKPEDVKAASEKAFNDAVDAAAAKKIAEDADKKPADPTYEPPPDNIVKQAAYLKRDAEKGGKAVEQLLTELTAQGLVIEQADGVGSSDQAERIDKMERDNARLKAGIKYELSEDDIAILDGTPDEIDSKGKYMRERIDTAVLKGGERKDDDPNKPGTPPETKPDAPSFEKYVTRPADPQAAIKQAEADMAESWAAGNRPGGPDR
jgi:hypothetical protein